MSKVLLVDDDKDFAHTTSEVLKSDGHVVVFAHDGDSGYELALKVKPDVILLDVMMKHDTEGFEIVKKLRKNESTKNLPVIMITGVRRAKNLPFRYEPDDEWLPVTAVLEKPVKPEVLLKHVKEAAQSGKTA